MAKIIIEIEDSILNDKVKFTMSPSFATLAEKIRGGHGRLTSAEGYAIACANLVKSESKKNESLNIKLPRLRRGL